MFIFFIILQALLGLSFTIGKLSLAHGSPLFLVATRMVVGGVILLLSHSIRRKQLYIPSRQTCISCLPYALCGIFGFPTLRAWGLQFVPSAKASLVFTLFPIITALIAFVSYGEQLAFLQCVGMCIGSLGMLPLILSHSSAGAEYSSLLPDIALFCSVILLSYSTLNMQQLIRKHDHTPLTANGVSMLIGGIFALLSAYAAEPIWVHGDFTQLGLLISSQIVISNVICANIQAFLLKQYSATLLSLSSCIAPLSAMAYGSFFLQESITWHFFISLAAIITGLCCYHAQDLYKLDHWAARYLTGRS